MVSGWDDILLFELQSEYFPSEQSEDVLSVELMHSYNLCKWLKLAESDATFYCGLNTISISVLSSSVGLKIPLSESKGIVLASATLAVANVLFVVAVVDVEMVVVTLVVDEAQVRLRLD